MVARNARLRMNSLPVGNWCDQLDAQRLRMDVVASFQACLRDNVLRKPPCPSDSVGPEATSDSEQMRIQGPERSV
jgi:hypothetical protein